MYMNELVSYFIYIYFLVFITVQFPPTPFRAFLLALYVIICSILICSKKNCPLLTLSAKGIYIFIYTCICVASYYFAHYLYFSRYQWILWLSPILYFITVKTFLYMMGCDLLSNYHFATQINFLSLINKMDAKLMMFMQIMVFYALLSYVIGPVIGYYAFGHSIQSAGYGFIVGSIISVMLWHFFGSKMV